MRRSDELQEALRALGEKHRAVGAPAGLESKLRAAVRSKNSWIWWAIPAVAAAAVLALLFVRMHRPAADVAVPPVTATSDARFVLLPAGFGLPGPGATSIVRVEIRKGDLRRYGFDVPPPVADQLVRADFIVGEDGLARAVRLAGVE